MEYRRNHLFAEHAHELRVHVAPGGVWRHLTDNQAVLVAPTVAIAKPIEIKDLLHMQEGSAVGHLGDVHGCESRCPIHSRREEQRRGCVE